MSKRAARKELSNTKEGVIMLYEGLGGFHRGGDLRPTLWKMLESSSRSNTKQKIPKTWSCLFYLLIGFIIE